MNEILTISIVAGVPLLLAVLGESLLQRSGVINVGLEGMMLIAALAAVFTAQASGSFALGLAGGVAGALAAALLFGFVTIARGGDQIVAGTAVNFLAAGLTSVAYGRLREVTHPLPEPWKWDFASSALLRDPFVALAWLVMPAAVAFLLWRTRFGLRLRAAGEFPPALEVSGLSAGFYRGIALLVEAVLVGMGGAYLSLGLSSGFAENMVAGRGFIALAIVVFARWKIIGATAGVALFALTSGAQYWLQAASRDVPFHLLLALPYVVTLIILAGFAGKTNAPRWLARS